MKKLADISGQLKTVKQIIFMEDKTSSGVSTLSWKSDWNIVSFDDVKKLGQANPADAKLPQSTDIAVIMYTSGSTGMPKVSHTSYNDANGDS